MMIITDAQRFIYGLLALACITMFMMVISNHYSLKLFLLFLIIEFLAVVELTKPPFFRAAWRKHITVVVVVCTIMFVIAIYITVTEIANFR